MSLKADVFSSLLGNDDLTAVNGAVVQSIVTQPIARHARVQRRHRRVYLHARGELFRSRFVRVSDRRCRRRSVAGDRIVERRFGERRPRRRGPIATRRWRGARSTPRRRRPTRPPWSRPVRTGTSIKRGPIRRPPAGISPVSTPPGRPVGSSAPRRSTTATMSRR